MAGAMDKLLGFLVDAFDTAALRRIAATTQADLPHELPGAVASHKDVAAALIEQCERRGILSELLENLRAERPRRSGEIDEIGAQLRAEQNVSRVEENLERLSETLLSCLPPESELDDRELWRQFFAVKSPGVRPMWQLEAEELRVWMVKELTRHQIRGVPCYAPFLERLSRSHPGHDPCTQRVQRAGGGAGGPPAARGAVPAEHAGPSETGDRRVRIGW